MNPQYDEFEACHPVIREAVGFADMGMWPEARDSFHSLPEEVRHQPGLHRLRLRICAGVEDFTAGPELAWSGWLEAPADLEAAGRYLLGMARFYCDRDEIRDAFACQSACCAIWPACGMKPLVVPEFTSEDIPAMLAAVEESWRGIESRRPAPLDVEGVFEKLNAGME